MRLRCWLLVAVVFFFGAFPVFGSSAHPDEKMLLKVVLQQQDLASSDRFLKEILQQIVDESGDNLSLSQSKKRFFEIYFDSPTLVFLNKNGHILYRAEEYLTKKKKKKKYYEEVFYNSGSDETLTLEVKHYSKMQTGVGKHPLFSLVKRKQRPGLLTRLHQDGVKYPLSLKSIFQVARNTHSFTVISHGKELLSIHSSLLKGIRSKSEADFGLVTVDINRELFTRLGEQQKNHIRDLLARLENSGFHVAPEEVDYETIFRQMEKRIMFFYLLLRYPSLVNFLYAFVIGSVGGLFIILFFRKRKF